jgi:hypothetical protein
MILFHSCEKEEYPISPKDKGALTTLRVETGNDYRYQIWLDLETGTQSGSILKNSWDLAFYPNGQILLNGGMLCKAALSEQNWENTLSAAGQSFRSDSPNGHPDSTAIGNWQSHQKIIIIDRGFDENGNSLGYLKLQLLSFENGIYTFKYANLNGSNEKSIRLETDARYEAMLFSLPEAKTAANVPEKSTYDICFTQYTHIFYEPYTPYLVSGVLLSGQPEVQAGTDSTLVFETVNRDKALTVALSTARDAIGYDWKTYSFDSGKYVIDAKRTYIIRDRKGYYYKLRFLDFYNEKGEKGSILFAYQRL